MNDRNQCCLFFFSRGTFVWAAVCLHTKGQASQSPHSFKLYWLLALHASLREKTSYLGAHLLVICYALSVCMCFCECVCLHCVTNVLCSPEPPLHICTFQYFCIKLCWTHHLLHLYKLLFHCWTFFQNSCRELSNFPNPPNLSGWLWEKCGKMSMQKGFDYFKLVMEWYSHMTVTSLSQ